MPCRVQGKSLAEFEKVLVRTVDLVVSFVLTNYIGELLTLNPFPPQRSLPRCLERDTEKTRTPQAVAS